MIINPFEDDYLKQEVDFMAIPEYDRDGVTVLHKKIVGRCDDYLNTNFRSTDYEVPILYIDQELWMSLTFMEVESAYLPITLAEGKVCMLGLGLGYSILRAACKPEVTEIIVYENESRIIQMFKDLFSDREGFEKISFVEGDARETFKGVKCDVAFVDIYQTLLPDEVIEDAINFQKDNDIGRYMFWGQEKAILDYYNETDDMFFDYIEKDYIKMWLKSGKQDLYRSHISEEFGYDVLLALGRI